MEWDPVIKLEMQATEEAPGAYKMVLFADHDTESMSALNHNIPSLSKWRTNYLFKRRPDPRKAQLWSYYGREDDIIVLSNSEKFNPVAIESIIQDHSLVADALIVGQGKRQVALVLKLRDVTTSREALLNRVWSQLKKASAIAPAHS